MACPVDPHTTITQEILLPDGYRLLACPEEYVEALRKRYVADPMVGADLVEDSEAAAKVLVVAHGSHEHTSHLRRAMEAVENLLHGIGHHKHEEPVGKRKLESNFEKFGFNASVRMFDRKSGTATPGGSSVMRLDSQVDDGDETKCQQASGIRLWKRPVVRQYFHQGLLWRAEEETTVMSFELFFDLLYVGIIAINGDHVAEEADGHELLRFVITFGMSWKIWQDVAQMISWFEVDDVLQRIEIVFLIACLLGFTTNMLHVFNEGYDTYTQLVAFYLATRLFNAAYCAVTGYLLPIVKGMMIAQVVLILIPSALWIASIHVEMPNRLALVFIALILDIFGNATIISAFRYSRKNISKFAKRIGRFFEFYPAINIEHKVERTNAFVTLVLGYSVVVVLFQNEGWGLNAFLGKAILGLVQAFIFNWLYFEIDGANIATHAIRRHVWSATMWQNAHIPYVMGYVLGTAALGKLVLGSDCDNADPHTLTEFYRSKSEEEIHDGLRWLYCGGLGVALFSTTFINYSHVHRDLDNGRVPLLSKVMRLGNRTAVTAIILCLPLAHEHLNSLHLVSTTTGLMVWVLVVDLIGSMCWKALQGKEKRSRRRMGYTARCSLKELEEAVRKAELEQSSDDGEVESQGGAQVAVKDIGETNLSKSNSTGEKAEAG